MFTCLHFTFDNIKHKWFFNIRKIFAVYWVDNSIVQEDKMVLPDKVLEGEIVPSHNGNWGQNGINQKINW